MSTVLKDAFSVTRVSFWTGFLVSTLVGGVLYGVTQRSIEGDARERFQGHAEYAQGIIDIRIKSYTNLLRGTASMLQSSPAIDHRGFHDYVQGLALSKNFPAVDNINYAAYVADDGRDAFMAHLNAEMRPLLAPGMRIVLTPPDRRPSYLVMSYIEPDTNNARHYGISLMSIPYFRSQFAQARDDDRLHSSGRPIAALSAPNDMHLGLRLPVYRHGMPFGTVDERRRAYAGSLGIAFSVSRLVHGVMDEMPLSGVRMTLFDVGPRDPMGNDTSTWPKVLFDNHGSARNPAPPLDRSDDSFSTTLPLDFNGRTWQTTYSVEKFKLYTAFDGYYPKLMMVLGFVGSVLLYALLHTLTSSRRAALSLARDMTSELRESQSKLQCSHQKLRRLTDHAYQIKELERKRIAREIHDDLGQGLLALRIDAELLAGRTQSSHSKLHRRARATLLQIDTTIRSVRQIINDLRPTVLDLGLSAALEWQVHQFQHRSGIQCELRDEHGDIPLPDHCATAFFRILQESLSNIVRHANATRVTVELRLTAGWLSMAVHDNGRGLPPGGRNKYGSFGLVGIEERIVILGGTCAVHSEPGAGTTVTVAAPVIGLHIASLDHESAGDPRSALI